MNRKLFVGNLSYNIEDNDLQELFSQYGEVTYIKIVKDFDTGRSKGFAFVEFADATAATQALQALNNQEWNGRALKIAEARERQRNGAGDRNGGGRSGGGYGGDRNGGGRNGGRY